jgi:CysZ protein
MRSKFFIKEFGLGISTYRSAFSFIVKNKLTYFYLAPLLITIVFWISGFIGMSFFTSRINTIFNNWFGVTISAPSFNFFSDYKEIISQTGNVLITIILYILMFYLVYRLNKYVMLILLSPVLAYLSEKVEVIITGNDFPFNTKQFLKDVLRGIIIALRNMLIEVFLIIVIWAITFVIPILAPFTALLLIVISAYFYGFSMIDYTNERRKYNFSESITFIRNHKGLVIGNGLIYHFIFMIPIAGAVFAPITAAVAATLGVIKINHQK